MQAGARGCAHSSQGTAVRLERVSVVQDRDPPARAPRHPHGAAPPGVGVTTSTPSFPAWSRTWGWPGHCCGGSDCSLSLRGHWGGHLTLPLTTCVLPKVQDGFEEGPVGRRVELASPVKQPREDWTAGPLRPVSLRGTVTLPGCALLGLCHELQALSILTDH